MELAIQISDINILKQCDDPYVPQKKLVKDKYGYLYEKLELMFQGKKPDRLYFGSEFCAHLIPSIQDYQQVYKYSVQNGLDFSIVTPCVFEDGIDKVRAILDEFKTLQDLEVICNDWGMVRIISEEYQQFKPVLGRLLDKLPREPRIDRDQMNEIYGKNGMDFYRAPNVFTEEYLDILKGYNISRVELDCVPQGLNLHGDMFEICGHKISLYGPFCYVTTGVICMYHLIDLPENDKFNFKKGCGRACLKYDAIMHKDMFVNRKTRTIQALRKGNTVYKIVDNMDEYLSENPIVDRFIMQYL